MPDDDIVENEPVETPADDEQDNAEDESGTYPAKVVKDLRKENATYREKAKNAEARAEELSHALFSARVEATGKLASPNDLPFDAALLDDADALDAAIDAVIGKNPHYAKRRVQGDIGQGQPTISTPQDFSSLLRS